MWYMLHAWTHIDTKDLESRLKPMVGPLNNIVLAHVVGGIDEEEGIMGGGYKEQAKRKSREWGTSLMKGLCLVDVKEGLCVQGKLSVEEALYASGKSFNYVIVVTAEASQGFCCLGFASGMKCLLLLIDT